MYSVLNMLAFSKETLKQSHVINMHALFCQNSNKKISQKPSGLNNKNVFSLFWRLEIREKVLPSLASPYKSFPELQTDIFFCVLRWNFLSNTHISVVSFSGHQSHLLLLLIASIKLYLQIWFHFDVLGFGSSICKFLTIIMYPIIIHKFEILKHT